MQAANFTGWWVYVLAGSVGAARLTMRFRAATRAPGGG
jgi:hypothetical protein